MAQQSGTDNMRTIRLPTSGLPDLPSNAVHSSRFTAVTVVPKSLLEQFHRFSNVWFLAVSIFQLVFTRVSVSSGWDTLVPLVAILLFTLAKDAYLLYRQQAYDQAFNRRKVTVWADGKYEQRECGQILVGQVVAVETGQTAPADLLLLATGSADSLCYTDTSLVTGDRSLQVKKPVRETSTLLKFKDLQMTATVLPKLQGQVIVTQPNPDFRAFSGKVKLRGFPTASRLTPGNLMLQGAELRSTAWVLGLVVYTGPETKLRLNGAQQARKLTALERKVNRLVLLLLPLLLLPTLISAVLATFAVHRQEEDSDFFDKLVNFCLLYNNVIPISLFVSLDLVRVLQGVVMRRRLSEAHINNPDVSEDMGQIEYLVVGKNGSVTQPGIVLRTIVIDDKEYRFLPKRSDSETTVQRQGSQSVIDDSRVVFPKNSSDEVLDRSLSDDKNEEFDVSEFAQDLKKSEKHWRLMQAVAACHCLVSNETGTVGDSEELALMAETGQFGVRFVRREQGRLILKTADQEISVALLGWTSTFQQASRTRVLVQWPGDSFALLFSKGPGSAMKSILSIALDDLEILQEREEKLQRSGLRTVLFACKEISESELEAFGKEFNLATRSLFNVEDRVDTLFAKYESGSKLLGMLGIEESLAPDARDTLLSLQKSGIQPWLVSADTELSTVTTAFNLGLFAAETSVVSFRQKSDSVELEVLMTRAVKQMILGEEQQLLSRSGTLMLDCKRGDSLASPNVHRLQMFDRQNSTSHALLRRATMKIKDDPVATLPLSTATADFSLSIDGTSLDTALSSSECRQLLIALLFAAKGVCFNQLLPLQKATVVKMLREQFDFRPVTLAVGSNDADIPMVSAANVGVSVGTSANSRLSHISDVRVDSLSTLKPLVVVHGRWNLMRSAKVVLLFVYKNVLLTLFLMAYSFFSDFQPPRLFPQGLIASYNILFTTFPVLVIGVWDQDVPQSAVLSHSVVYQYGIQGKYLTYTKFALFLILALCQTVIISASIVPNLGGILTVHGCTESFEVIGTLIFLAVDAAVLIQVTLLSAAITLLYCVSIVVCIVILYLFILLSNWTDWADSVAVLEFIYTSGTGAIRLALAPVAAGLFGYAVVTYLRLFAPTINDVLQQKPTRLPEVLPWSRAAEYESDLRRVYKSSSKPDKPSDIDASKVHPITLKFSSLYMEKAYKAVYFQQFLPIFRVVSTIMVLLLVSWLVYNSLIDSKTETATSQSVMIVTLLLILLSTKLKGYKKRYTSVTIYCVFGVLLVKFIAELLFHRIGGLSSSIVPVATFGLLNVDFLANIGLNALSIVLISISLSVNFALWTSEDAVIQVTNILQFLVLIVGISTTCAVLAYCTSKLDRLHFKLFSSLEAQAEKVRSILCCFLPEFVRERVRKGTRYIAEEKGVVTVLFCDICDFDAICARLTPVELTSFLDELFQQFDSACEVNGVFKVETVGKTYMACAGLRDTEKSLPAEIYQRNHARRAIELAFHILRIVQKYRMADGEAVQVKVGINSGPVVAGVVGFHKPQFSLVGDTVNTASRMCSTIETSNTIQISNATREMLEDSRGIKFDEHIVTGVKGKGDMLASFVTERPLTLSDDGVIDGDEEDNKRASILFQSTIDPQSIQQYKKSATVAAAEMKKMKLCWDEDKALRLVLIKDTFPVIRLGLISAAAVRVSIVALRAVAYGHSSAVASDECLIAYSVSAGFTLLLALTASRLHQIRGFPYIVFSLCVVSSLFALSDYVYSTKYHPDLIALEVMYATMVLTFCSGLHYRWAAIGSSISVALWAAATPMADDIGLHLANLSFIVGFAGINIYAAAVRERKVKMNSELKQFAVKEIEQTDELLSHMLPPHVYESLKQEKNVTEQFSNVTILFADIVGFTSWSSAKTPFEVVTMLSELFTRFDKLCVTNQVYKVHTIGDCYVAMGYAGESAERDVQQECLNIVDLAFDMVKVITEINEANGSQLNMRIGVHTGEVIAGITGTNVVRYDIYGPDVLIANKMESNGMPGKVNVSDRTKHYLERADDSFRFLFNKDVEAKAVGRKHQSFFASVDGERKVRDRTARSANSEMVLATKAKVDTSEDMEFITLPV